MSLLTDAQIDFINGAVVWAIIAAIVGAMLVYGSPPVWVTR